MKKIFLILLALGSMQLSAQNDPTGDQWIDEGLDIITPAYNDPWAEDGGDEGNWGGNVGINEFYPKRLLHISKKRTDADNDESVFNTVGMRLSLDVIESGAGPVNPISWDMFVHNAGYIGFKRDQMEISTLKIYPGLVGINLGLGVAPQSTLHLKDGAVQVGMTSDPFYTRLTTNSLEFDRDFRSYIIQKNAGGQIAFGFVDANNLKMVIDNSGNVGIGRTDPGHRLDVVGTIRGCELIVEDPLGWCDYVFAEDYKLKPLSEVESYIQANKHLPNVPSADQIGKEGIRVAEMTHIMMEKIEELTLYMIELEKENKKIKQLLEERK